MNQKKKLSHNQSYLNNVRLVEFNDHENNFPVSMIDSVTVTVNKVER
jgi:hypothetical protein